MAVRDHATYQASHPIGEHHAGDLAEGLEEHSASNANVVSARSSWAKHEPDPAALQDSAEHVQSAQHTPIDDQMLTGSTAGRRPR